VIQDEDGVTWGQAAEIAQRLGPDVTRNRVYDWARRGLLDRRHVPGRGRGTTWFRLDQAADVERRTRTSTRGRKRGI
jgi:hypothetical protein